MQGPTLTIDAPSPASPGSVAYFARLLPLAELERIDVEATVSGAEGGDLEVFLEERIGPGIWRERIHFGTFCAGSMTEHRTRSFPSIDTGEFRIVLVAGNGTTAGTSAAIRITPHMRVTWN